MIETLFPVLIGVELAFALVAFIILLFINAPYGRHVRGGWGPTLDARWAWALQELPAFAVIFLLYFYYGGYTGVVASVFLLIWQAHYFHRTFIYPRLLRGEPKPFPVLIVIVAAGFNGLNGTLHGVELFHLRAYSLNWLWSPQFLIGAALFLLGYRINRASDATLRQLRGSGDGYQLPTGGLYEQVSCPNYLGEMLQWLGWAILTWSLAGLAFFAFTVANLLPRALANHRWYLEHFEDYPGNRRAVIPFVL